jgi:predicted acetyltransferase
VGDPIVRKVASEDDVRGALTCLLTAFHEARDVSDEGVAWAAERWDRDRAWIAVDGDDGVVCGTTRTFGSRLRLPGLSDVPVSCLTSVTVLPTHTRRGTVTQMMREQLSHAVEVGEVASLLVAAEWPIYGRFGYGVMSEWVEWEVDTSIAEFVAPRFGSLRLVDAATLEKAATAVLARQQAATVGSIERPPWFLAMTTGADPRPWEKSEGRKRLVHYDDDGEPDGYAMYDPKERWDGMRPQTRLEVHDLVAATPEAERELWRYLAGVDLVDRVTWGGSPNSVLPFCMADGRAARQEGRWDHIWARILDVPACLTGRSYARSGRVVLEVVDGFMDRGGRFVLDVSPDGASCVPIAGGGESVDVTLGVAALSAAWVGGTDLRRAAAGGGLWAVDEHRPGALASLAGLLRWHETPYCSTDF